MKKLAISAALAASLTAQASEVQVVTITCQLEESVLKVVSTAHTHVLEGEVWTNWSLAFDETKPGAAYPVENGYFMNTEPLLNESVDYGYLITVSGSQKLYLRIGAGHRNARFQFKRSDRSPGRLVLADGETSVHYDPPYRGIDHSKSYLSESGAPCAYMQEWREE